LTIFFPTQKAQGKEPEESFLDQVMETEDKDKDGSVTWEEFGGPKGDSAPG